ncbi:MAG: hypothetical protein RX318_03995 [bacterium]|nr:hypothetical protein [bacterium]
MKPSLIVDLIGLAGLALVVYGAALVSTPSGLITGGLSLCAIALLAAKRLSAG